MASDYLQFSGIKKHFPGVRALDGVTFGVAEGSVHALMGENGAGKSTLLKILSGAHRPTEGALSIDGKPCAFSSTADAIKAGVAVIYQELHLAPELSGFVQPTHAAMLPFTRNVFAPMDLTPVVLDKLRERSAFNANRFVDDYARPAYFPNESRSDTRAAMWRKFT